MLLSTDRKGTIAELAIARAAYEIGIDVYSVDRLVRIQCKWATRYGDVIVVRCASRRRGRHGLIRRPYEAGDAFTAYCAELDRCYYLPFEMFRPPSQIQLRLGRSKNNQRAGVNWAKHFEFGATLRTQLGAIAQLGERVHGMHEVAGSSPAGSTFERTARTVDGTR
jgi:hypothetical protein